MGYATFVRRRLAGVGVVALAACGGGGDGGTTNPPPVGGFSVALSATTLSVVAGGSSSLTATVARTGSFAGAVDLSTEGVPSGVTAAFSPASIASGATATTLNVAVATSVVPGNYQFSVRGKGAGLPDHTIAVALTVTAPPSIALSLTSNASSVGAGGTATFTANLTRTNFTGPVTVAVAGLPANVTANVAANGDAYAVTLAVQSGASQGAYPLTVTATGSGVAGASATHTLTVTAASAIALAASPSSASVQAGGSTQFTVNISRTNYVGAVTLSVIGLPIGATTAIATSPTLGSSAVVTVATSATTPSGRFSLVVSGNGTGGVSASATFDLTVTAPSAGGNVIWDYAGCNASETPVWFAAQSGSGAWTRVTRNNDEAFVFSMGATGGVAFVTQRGSNDYAIDFVYGTFAELQNGAGVISCTTDGDKTITGTVAGLTNSSSLARVSLGRASATVQLSAPTFRLTNVDFGSLDLVATRQLLNLVNPAALPTTDRLIIRRGLNIGSGSALPALDFGSGEAFNPEVRTATVSGLTAGEDGQVLSSFHTLNPTVPQLSASAFLSLQQAPSGSAVFAAVPSARLLPSDLHIVQASGTNDVAGRYVASVFRDPANVALALPPALSAPAIGTLASTPYVRTRAQLARQSEYDRTWSISFTQPGRSVVARVSAGYLGGSALDFQFPDFTGLAGWQGTWAPAGGVLTAWTVVASGWSLGGGGFVAPTANGTTMRWASRAGSFTP